MYYTVIKHSGRLSTLEKCRKHWPPAHVFYPSLMFSNAHGVLSQCNTQLGLYNLLNNAARQWGKKPKKNLSNPSPTLFLCASA